MKKVSVEYGCRALGYNKYVDYFPDEMTTEQIADKVKDDIGFYFGMDVEAGYEAVQVTEYHKR